MTYALIINASPLTSQQLQEALEKDDVRTKIAPTEDEALIFLQEAMPELIVWDWPPVAMSPGVFMASLRQEGYDGSLVICAKEAVRNDVPCDLLVGKPYELSSFTRVLRRFLHDLPEDVREDAQNLASGCHEQQEGSLP